jgi:hypothetical protein
MAAISTLTLTAATVEQKRGFITTKNTCLFLTDVFASIQTNDHVGTVINMTRPVKQVDKITKIG